MSIAFYKIKTDNKIQIRDFIQKHVKKDSELTDQERKKLTDFER